MNTISDYSEIENFNIAAIEAVRENFKIYDVKDNKVSVVYKYKGRVLMATAKISLDGENARYVGILNVEMVKGEEYESNEMQQHSTDVRPL